jgi:arginase
VALTRREFTTTAAAAMVAVSLKCETRSMSRSPTLILAPSNLGLRPNEDGSQSGTWRAPQTLLDAGLASAVDAGQVIWLERPGYQSEAQFGTAIRNGLSIRAFSLQLSDKVADVLRRGGFPIVVGGDCSILLGSLYGSRICGGRGVVHVDGHSDFFHPGNYDTGSRLGSAAGMDLALASGRGELLLTHWPELGTPLAEDADIIQVGERSHDPEAGSFRNHVADTQITQFTIQHLTTEGIQETARQILSCLEKRRLSSAWLHVDFDVLDQIVMPAVDSPGSPGLDTVQLASLIDQLCVSGRIAGADFTIYDPERDTGVRYAKSLVDCIGKGVRAGHIGGRNP